MNPLSAIRRRRRPLVIRVLAMLGVVWLGMVLQPCVMAGEMGMDMTQPCPHCPAPMTDDCDGAASNVCTYFDWVDYDARSPHSTLSKKFDHTVIPVATSLPEYPHPTSICATGPPRDAGLELPAVPINVLYCVYLN